MAVARMKTVDGIVKIHLLTRFVAVVEGFVVAGVEGFVVSDVEGFVVAVVEGFVVAGVEGRCKGST
jgi:hypothetical protein